MAMARSSSGGVAVLWTTPQFAHMPNGQYTAINHYDAVSTFHDDDICDETRLSMHRAGCLELTNENCSQL